MKCPLQKKCASFSHDCLNIADNGTPKDIIQASAKWCYEEYGETIK